MNDSLIYHTAPQGSDAWLAARVGVITGSRFKDARDRSSGLTAQQTAYVVLARSGKDLSEAATIAGYKKAPTSEAVAKAIKNGIEMVWGGKATAYAHDLARERCGGKAAGVFVNAAMKFGTEQEPFARMAYEDATGNLVEEVGFITSACGTFGLSPDGLVGNDGVLEVKTMVSSDTLFTAVADGDISAYIDQCHGYLWMLGRQWVDLVLFAPDLEPLGLHLTIRRIERDEAAIEALQADLLAFAAMVKENEDKLRRLAVNAGQLRQAA